DAAVPARVLPHVGNQLDPAVLQYPAGDALVGWEADLREALLYLRRDVGDVGHVQLVGVAVEQHDGAAFDLEQRNGAGDDRRQQLVEVDQFTEGAADLIEPRLLADTEAHQVFAVHRFSIAPLVRHLCTTEVQHDSYT